MASNKRSICRYGSSCFRKNSEHLLKYRHDVFDLENKKTVLTSKKDTKKSKIDESQVQVTVFQSNSEEMSSKVIQDFICERLFIKLPEDFYQLAEFCKSLTTSANTDFRDVFLDLFGIKLVGPYDIIAGKVSTINGNNNDWLTHWRYYYDPPEMFTVLSFFKGDQHKKGYHCGYFYDDPNEFPTGLVENYSKLNGIIKYKASNIFSLLFLLINDINKKNDMCQEGLLLQQKLLSWATANSITLQIDNDFKKIRDKKIVCKTFHGFGLIVPLNKNVGYRELPETDASLKRIFTNIINTDNRNNEEEKLKSLEPLDELITLTQFANDECDYGQGIELGLDLFSFGGDVFNKTISSLLSLGYKLVNKEPFSKIITAHMLERSDNVILSKIN